MAKKTAKKTTTRREVERAAAERKSVRAELRRQLAAQKHVAQLSRQLRRAYETADAGVEGLIRFLALDRNVVMLSRDEFVALNARLAEAEAKKSTAGAPVWDGHLEDREPVQR